MSQKIFAKDLVDLIDTLAQQGDLKTLARVEELLRQLVQQEILSSELELQILHDYVLDLIHALRHHQDPKTAVPDFVRESIFLSDQ